jgi:hypothetical protein
MDYLFNAATSWDNKMVDEGFCNAWVMHQINYQNVSKRVNRGYMGYKDFKVVLFEFSYDPQNNHFNSEFIPGTDTLVHTHVRSAAFTKFCCDFITKGNDKLGVYVRHKIDYSKQEEHPYLWQVVMRVSPGAFDDPEMPSLIPLDQTFE